MDGYTCIKALTLGGVGYAAGENIPAGAVLPGRVRALIKQGYISPVTAGAAAVTAGAAAVPPSEAETEAVAELQRQIAELQTAAGEVRTELQQVTGERDALREQLAEAQAGPDRIIIPLTRDGGVLEVPAAPESVVAAVCNLQLTAEDGIKAIEAMTDETALILIHALDSRKTVKAAAQARAAALEDKSGDGTPPEGEEGQGDA